VYLDSAYIAKFYVNERDSPSVRAAIRRAAELVSSAWAIGEVACVLHRHMREDSLNGRQFRELLDAFLAHVESGVWTMVPLTPSLLKRTAALVRSAPAGAFLRAGDAIHLATARDAGESEIWTSDRHMLAAAPHFGLQGRSV
jgi:predicted nucleic acid-binding protein